MRSVPPSKCTPPMTSETGSLRSKRHRRPRVTSTMVVVAARTHRCAALTIAAFVIASMMATASASVSAAFVARGITTPGSNRHCSPTLTVPTLSLSSLSASLRPTDGEEAENVEIGRLRMAASSPSPRRTGRKRALARRYAGAFTVSLSLLCGPSRIVPKPFFRHGGGISNGRVAHAAASSTMEKMERLQPASSGNAGSSYNFKDFKDVKKKLSLKPGANVVAYEEVSERVAVEGDVKGSGSEEVASVTIGGEGDGGDGAGSGEGTEVSRKEQRALRKEQKRKESRRAQMSEWEEDELGLGAEEDDDEHAGILSLGSGSAKLSPGKKSQGGGTKTSGEGDVEVTDRMAFNNYKVVDTQKGKMTNIRKGAFYSILPVAIITLIRGRFKDWKETAWVKKGLEIVEEQRQEYIKELEEGKHDEDEDFDDDDDEGGEGKKKGGGGDDDDEDE